jgi:two-component system, chemotaxis family, protein-glutamate methylesterase/glutaminase
VRILIAEDSPTQLAYLQLLLERDGSFSVVGTAVDGMEAVEKAAQLRPDIVLMDFKMPRMNGVEATRAIMERTPVPIVITSAGLLPQDVALAIAALESGAMAVVAKPMDPLDPAHDRQTIDLLQTLKLMSEVKVVRRWTHAMQATTPPVAPVRKMALEVIAMGGSSGAPGVFGSILAGLPGDLPPILLVQHMAAGFIEGFTLWLAQKTTLKVCIAKAGIEALRGTVYVAPEGRHLAVSPERRILLEPDPPELGFRPSINHLFRSVAGSFGSSAMGVILTGMGQDGVAGLTELHRAGGITVAQDEASCVVFGMPRVAIRQDCVTHILPPAGIANLIRSNYLGHRTQAR